MIRKHSDYTFEYYERKYDTEHCFDMPFNTDSDPEHIYIAENGLKAVLAFLVRDDSPSDPFEEFDDGEFYQFDRSYKHATECPEIEDFKRIVRANPGRVVTVKSYGEGYRAGDLVTPAMCREIKSVKGRSVTSQAEIMLDDAAGYYIAPEDVTDPLKYAEGSIETYSQWCEGEVYGVVVWTYKRSSIADSWGEPEREECWGFYGYDGYTADELKSLFDAEVCS